MKTLLDVLRWLSEFEVGSISVRPNDEVGVYTVTVFVSKLGRIQMFDVEDYSIEQIVVQIANDLKETIEHGPYSVVNGELRKWGQP